MEINHDLLLQIQCDLFENLLEEEWVFSSYQTYNGKEYSPGDSVPKDLKNKRDLEPLWSTLRAVPKRVLMPQVKKRKKVVIPEPVEEVTEDTVESEPVEEVTEGA